MREKIETCEARTWEAVAESIIVLDDSLKDGRRLLQKAKGSGGDRCEHFTDWFEEYWETFAIVRATSGNAWKAQTEVTPATRVVESRSPVTSRAQRCSAHVEGGASKRVVLARGFGQSFTMKGLDLVTVGMNFIVKPGQQEEFERKLEAVLAAFTAAAHDLPNGFGRRGAPKFISTHEG